MATCILLDTEETSERTKTDKELPFIFKCRGGGVGREAEWEEQTQRDHWGEGRRRGGG